MIYSRRTALELALALWAKAEEQAHQHGTSPAASTNFQARFLSRDEISTVQRYAAVLIPSSERSGGAAAAQVETYVDHILANAAPSLQRAWRAGLAAWKKAKDTEAHLRQVAANEFSPKTREDQFFVMFKSAITAAFYTSKVGIEQELGYQGMGFLREFPGYQGEPFVTPADYKPLLKARS
jgi:hypothetical protein